MIHENTIQRLDKLCRISGYPLHVYDDAELLYPHTKSLSDPFLADTDLIKVLTAQETDVVSEIEGKVLYALAHIENLQLAAGSVCLHHFEESDKMQYFHSHNIMHAWNLHIIKGSADQLRDFLSLAEDILSEDMLSVEIDDPPVDTWQGTDMIMSSEESEHAAFRLLEFHQDAVEKDIPQMPYSLELEILNALKESDADAYRKALARMPDYSSGNFAQNSARYMEYGAVSLVTLFTRASIEGGTPESKAYALSDMFLRRISGTTGASDYAQLYTDIFRQFFELTASSQSLNQQSYHIHRCESYIQTHLNQELSPQIIAEKIGVTPNYLMGLFSREKQIPLMQYVQRERIRAAANMLKYSDYPIIHIASNFQFHSQSHFGEVFRKYMGITPSEYRRKNKPSGF